MTSWDDVNTALPPLEGSPPRHGRIRLGETYIHATSKKELPRATDHFRVEADDRGTTSAAAAEAFARVYGAAPTNLRAWLPGARPEDNLRAAWRLYGTRKLKRKCSGPPSAGGTGQAVQRRESDGVLEPCVCACDTLPKDSKLRCAFAWELLLLLPDVSSGVWDIVSGSTIGWRDVAAELEHAHRLAGSLHLLEVDVSLVPVHVNPPGEPSKTAYVVNVKPIGSARELVEGGGRFSLEDARAAHALEPGAIVPDRYALPPSSLDEAPDALLHHPAISAASPDVVDATPTPAPAPQTPAGEVLTPVRALAVGYAALTSDERAELRRRIPIDEGTRSSVVAGVIGPAWCSNVRGLLEALRERDCTFAELASAAVAAQFEADVIADNVSPPPREAPAPVVDVGEQTALPGGNAPTRQPPVDYRDV